MRKKNALSALAALAVVGVMVTAANALAARPFPEPPMCPDVYAPVLCADGNVYANGCYASLAGQTSCVPYDDSPTS